MGNSTRKISRRQRRQTLKSIDDVLSDPKDLSKEEIATLKALRSGNFQRTDSPRGFGGPSLVKDSSGKVRRIDPAEDGNPLRAVFFISIGIALVAGLLWGLL